MCIFSSRVFSGNNNAETVAFFQRHCKLSRRKKILGIIKSAVLFNAVVEMVKPVGIGMKGSSWNFDKYPRQVMVNFCMESRLIEREMMIGCIIRMHQAVIISCRKQWQ